MGESAMDDDGPRREVFQLLLKDAFTSSGLFIGWPRHMIPLHCVEAVPSNKFYIVGKMMSTCLVQGGQTPVCSTDGIADYLIYDEARSEPCIADIPDCIVQKKLK